MGVCTPPASLLQKLDPSSHLLYSAGFVDHSLWGLVNFFPPSLEKLRMEVHLQNYTMAFILDQGHVHTSLDQ